MVDVVLVPQILRRWNSLRGETGRGWVVNPMYLNVMVWVFWLSVAWLVYVYAGYPAALWILGRVRRVRPRTDANFLPTVSVLISARNEEKDIGWKIEETLKWNYPQERLEVLVASDASDDGTDEILRGIKDPRLTFVRMDQRGGKGRALNALSERASGEILFFTDANAHIGPDCLRRMAQHFADSRVGCVTGESHFPQQDRRQVVGGGASVYWGYECLIKRLEDRLGSVLACDGAIFCMRRRLYTPVLHELANDLELPIRVANAGYWVLHEPGAVVLEHETLSPRECYRARRRVAAQGMLALQRLGDVVRGKLMWQFVSRKLMRWLTLPPMLLILLLCVALAGKTFFLILLGLQSLFYAFALVGMLQAIGRRSSSVLFSTPFYVLLGSCATLVGTIDACLGRSFAIWEPPGLSRGRIDRTTQESCAGGGSD